MYSKIDIIIQNKYNLKAINLKKSIFSGLSSSHYEFTDIHNEKYIIKINKNLDILIGNDFINLISQKIEIINEMNKSKLPIEKCLKNNENNYFTEFDSNSILRIFYFQKGKKVDVSKINIEKIAKSLDSIHSFNSKISVKKLSLFYSSKLPYNFDYTSKNYRKFKIKLEKINRPNIEIKFFIKNFKLIENCIEYTKNSSIFFNKLKKGLVHQDFHSGNLILYKKIIHILDFDYFEYGYIDKCRALAILRYSFKYKRDLDKLIININKWLLSLNINSNKKLIKLYIDLMIYIEIEKLLRIFMRYAETEKHKKYLIQAKKVHIPNLITLMQYK